MNHLEQDMPVDPVQDPQRRLLVKGSITWGVVAAFAPMPVMQAIAAAPATSADVPAAVAAFQKASSFLTSKSVNATMATRAYEALKKRMPDIDKTVASINTLVADKQLAHMDAYLGLQDVDKGLDKQAKDIVRAMYLGVVGDDEKAELFAYEEAFMYDPTRDVLVVPTYGRGPDSWGPKPVESIVMVEK
ncbi:sorbitol dehydrogenase [Pigmentiphaga aceris]|uniref:Sorbitol dehydrogenase n=1 Tax=Pigmentiphaga aceris TaxID=1940612 RepID=A0A5C0B4M1_9BURK|nr:sugar dehydrogenase complex small subunit [Pigmentiphaga aceris]QEI08200.1 sorbitol dehydrogenase [Pigmentiphaga aceris]